MLEESLEFIIDTLTQGKIKADAKEDLGKLLQESYQAVREAEFPVHKYFETEYVRMLKNKGFIDVWLSFTFLCMFTQGIAIGRESEKIEQRDIEKTREKTCDRWPKCAVMRLNAFKEVSKEVIKWLKKYHQKEIKANRER